jgi:glucose/arabinose dehydrogenase
LEPCAIGWAPNGDFFVAESKANRIRVLPGANHEGQPVSSTVSVDGLKQPFGMAFYPPEPDPQFVCIANTDSVIV